MKIHSTIAAALAASLLGLAPGVRAQSSTRARPAASVAIPDTPAGQRLREWLAAFNTGSRDSLRLFVKAHQAPPPNDTLPADAIVNRQQGLFRQTQGFTLRRIDASTPERVTATAQARLTGAWMAFGLSVSADSLHRVMGMGFRNTLAPPELLPAQPFTDRAIRDSIDCAIDRLVRADAFSGVVVVAKNGKPMYQRAVGVADRRWNVPNRIDTRFNVASIGKMFTAVAIAQLVQQGKLSYDDTLAKLLPDYPSSDIARRVTVRQLLAHTSGIAQGFDLDSAFRRGLRTVKAYLPTTAMDSLHFDPGTRLEYSSYGYLLLGAIVERARGRDYYDYVREHIYRPAGMTESDSYELDTDPPNLATGYMDAPKGERRSNIFMLPVKGTPFGMGYATALDLVRFQQALTRHVLLDSAALAQVWTGVQRYTEPNSEYGFGFIVTPYNGTRIIGHGGGWVGITNKFDMYPDLGYTVVILSNIDCYPNVLAFRLREWLTAGRTRRVRPRAATAARVPRPDP
jgi:CubicO group peptidase (beta-lactamase class C family)